MTTRDLLDRDKIDSFVQTKLEAPVSLLRDLVDHGVSLVDKYAQQGGSLSDLIIIGHFFKHAVTMLDAVEIQLSRGAVFAADVSARSMLEAYIYLAWLLDSDSEGRARHFFVWHYRQKRAWARRAIHGTDEHTRFQNTLNMLSDMKDTKKRAALEAEAKKEDVGYTGVLTNANNKAINDAFDNMKKRAFDVHWYKPTGANSIGDIAKKLSMEAARPEI